MIAALYRASRAGVNIELIVRGICCLRPGVKGVSDRIRVRSIVGRFLEHTRVYSFDYDGVREIYCGSADWMDRNLFRRVEVAFPIENAQLKARVAQDLEWYLTDNVQAWIMDSDGRYSPANSAGETLSAQERLLALFTERTATRDSA
jgi:polyphosphate kinase